MPSTFIDLLADYRTEAADRFATRKEKVSVSSKPTDTKDAADVQCYKRQLFPGLENYLLNASEKFRRAKERPQHVRKRGGKPAQVLGHGNIVVALAAARRKKGWCCSRAEELHRVRARRDLKRVVNVVLACGIPKDVREEARERFLGVRLEQRRRRTVKESADPKRVGRLDAETEEYTQLCANGIRVDWCGFVQHIERCRDGLDRGAVLLYPSGRKLQTSMTDTGEEVRKRYAGRPDELYRRKTARKFATWTRQRKQREQEILETLSRAENEMKRRRGHDHLLSGRKAEDSSFLPFLFELDSSTYAFSSKITEAPKLRKVMLEKYSVVNQESADDLNTWEKAQHAAETNPLFHTRVMNRFT